MTLPTFYATGTVTVTAGSDDFTGAGTLWGNGAILAGDELWLPSQPEIPPQQIVADPTNGAGVLTVNWPGTSESNVPYQIRYKGITERSTAQTRLLLEQLGDLQSDAVAFTPAGSIVADTVQEAIEELDAEKAPQATTYTKTETDGLVAGAAAVAALRRVRAVAATNITIATGLNNGDALDGVSLITGDLVLVAGQSAPADNGVYVVGASPARDGSFDSYDEHPGVYISVMEGTTYADTLWRCTSNKGGTLGSTALVFSQFTSGVGGSTGANDNRLLRSDGTGGATAQNSPITVDDSGNTSGMGTLGVGAITTSGLLTTSNGQIKFPGTANPSSDANTFDEYEEGTFTAGVSFGNASVGITYSGQAGWYIKLARLVGIGIEVVLTNKGSSTGDARATGLPFAIEGGSYRTGLCTGYCANLTGLTAGLQLRINPGGTVIEIQAPGTTGSGTPATNSNFSNTTVFQAGGTYFAAA